MKIIMDSANLFAIDLLFCVLYLAVNCEEATVSNKRLPGKLIHLIFQLIWLRQKYSPMTKTFEELNTAYLDFNCTALSM